VTEQRPFCRPICGRTHTTILSANYRIYSVSWRTNGYTLELVVCREQTSTARLIHPHLTPSENRWLGWIELVATVQRTHTDFGMKSGSKRVLEALLSHTSQRVKSKVMLSESLCCYDHDDRVGVDPVEYSYFLKCILYWLVADTPSNECIRKIKTGNGRRVHSLCGVFESNINLLKRSETVEYTFY